MITITLKDTGQEFPVTAGTPLRDVLFEAGGEFPCGGHGQCKGCRVRVTAGDMAPSPDDRSAFSQRELDDGWRLACRHAVTGDVTLELAQWEVPVLSDHDEFAFAPRPGFGIAVDLGTTTLAAQLLDLTSGQVLATMTALNPQTRFGADVLTRTTYVLENGTTELTDLIRASIGDMVVKLAQQRPIARIVIAGNSTMHHLFGGLDIAPLAIHPFMPIHLQTLSFSGQDLGWTTAAPVEVLPCIGGHVGGDVLAGIAVTGLAHHHELVALIDLGTNGEVVVAKDGHMLCTATAAGPAFEGARISCGMRAASGAIDAVEAADGAASCRVIGNSRARGICGSGLVDAVAAGLDLGLITRSGRLAQAWALRDGIALTPQDVRELQLAKGAIAAGLALLTARFGATPADLDKVYLAGAFGNAINRTSAAKIGLIRTPVERIVPCGNTALKGTKRALFGDMAELEALARAVTFVPLAEEAAFQEAFAAEMTF